MIFNLHTSTTAVDVLALFCAICDVKKNFCYAFRSGAHLTELKPPWQQSLSFQAQLAATRSRSCFGVSAKRRNIYRPPDVRAPRLPSRTSRSFPWWPLRPFQSFSDLRLTLLAGLMLPRVDRFCRRAYLGFIQIHCSWSHSVCHAQNVTTSLTYLSIPFPFPGPISTTETVVFRTLQKVRHSGDSKNKGCGCPPGKPRCSL